MSSAFWLAGTAAAHSVAGIHAGERLVPLLGHIDRWGEVSMLRVTGRDVSFRELMAGRYRVDHAAAARVGAQQLDADTDHVHGAVFVSDHVLEVEDRSLHVLLMDIRAYTDPPASCTMVIPYRAPREPLGFGTHRPTIVDADNVPTEALDRLMGAFFAGMEHHQAGWEIWTASVVQEIDTFYAA